MSFKIVDTTLSGAVADNATTTVPYPVGTDAGTFKGAVGHKMMLGTALLASPADFTLTFGASNITVTNKYGSSWPDASRVYLEIQTPGDDNSAIKGVNRTIGIDLAYINLGAPDTLDADGIVTSVDPASNAALTLNGALVSGGVATLDVPRNVTITSAADDSAKSFTVTGKDEYGVTVVETITGANAGVAAGKKAFKTVSSVVCVGDPGTITVGTGDVLGLPLFVQDGDFILKEMQDDAVATAGTTVSGDQSEPSATTGDVRGTYDPNAACDGAKIFRLVIAATDPTYKGLAQYGG